ncbi:MAG: hypothetical protein J1F69_01365 [Clostridiales bacterium]|nr:hypothetical protein [Clostridiales bacterium]
MENKTLKTLIYIFVGMVGFGIGLIAVSMFISVVDFTSKVPMPSGKGTYGASLSLFDADWDSMDASPAFLIVSFLVLLIGLVMMAVDASVRQKLKKKVKGLNFVALAISVIGLIMLIMAAVYTRNDVEDSMMKIMVASAKAETGGELSDQQITLMLKMMVNFEMGTGAVMAIVGGVIAVLGSIMLIIPALDPIKLAAAPAQPATPTQPTSPAQPTAENPTTYNNNNNDTIA